MIGDVWQLASGWRILQPGGDVSRVLDRGDSVLILDVEGDFDRVTDTLLVFVLSNKGVGRMCLYTDEDEHVYACEVKSC